MKVRWRNLLVGGVAVTMILMVGYQPLVAAPPAGEVKTVDTQFGNEIPVPYLSMAIANDWMQLLYDHLVGCTPEGKFSPDLGLANRWEMSRDGLSWTFYLRKGVKFHDGVEVTAKDVKFSLEQFLLPDASSEDAFFMKKTLKSIEVKDPYTLVVSCKQPDIFLISHFVNMEGPCGMVVPKDYFEKVGKEGFIKRPIGSGPYKWHSQMPGSFIKLEATDKHWRDGVPKYKYMTYLIIPEEGTRIAMLRTGEADIARVSREAVKEVLSSGLSVMTKGNGSVLVFPPNMQWASPAFGDVNFRKALNLAVDKEAIIKQLFVGLATPLAGYPGPNISSVGAAPPLKPYPYDPQEARRLIKEGGWEGHEFNLMSYARGGCPEFSRVVEALAGYWEKVGLKPKIRVTEWNVARAAERQRKSQNSIHGMESTSNPNVGALVTKFMEKWYFQNDLSTVNIPELNEKFGRMGKSLDVTEVSKLLLEVYRYAYDQYLMVPICEIPEKIATTKTVPKWDLGLRRNDRNYNDLIKQR